MDTIHLALKYESTRGGKRTGGSMLLKRVMRKFHELPVEVLTSQQRKRQPSSILSVVG